MLKRKPLTPISLILLRQIRTTPRGPLVFIQHTQRYSSIICSSFPSEGDEYRVSKVFRSLRISWRSFCSKSVEEPRGICWNCSAVAGSTPFLVCESCRSVQPVDLSIDYFQIFGLDKKYEIVDDSLEGKYKSWQKKLHPDLVHSKSEKEREYAAEQSARVIDAYRTLSKPLSRAIYIMRLQGVDVDEEQTISDPELLAEDYGEARAQILGREPFLPLMQSYASIEGEESRRIIIVKHSSTRKECILSYSQRNFDKVKVELVEKEKKKKGNVILSQNGTGKDKCWKLHG